MRIFRVRAAARYLYTASTPSLQLWPHGFMVSIKQRFIFILHGHASDFIARFSRLRLRLPTSSDDIMICSMDSRLS